MHQVPQEQERRSVEKRRGRFTLRERLRYNFDSVVARGVGPILLIISLGLFVVVYIAALIQALFSWGPNDDGADFLQALWTSLTRTLDGGTIAADSGARFRLLGLVITLIGIVTVAMITSLMTHGIGDRVRSLRAGRSPVVESDHTLVLGWSLKVPVIVQELVEANSSRRSAAVVLLNDRPIDEITHRIRAVLPRRHSTRLVYRTGNPANLSDLERVSPRNARSVILVADDSETADALNVKAVLGVLQLCDGRPPPIVVELGSREVADALEAAAPGKVSAIVSSDIVGKLAAQVTRNAGMSLVYQELLDFAGSEFYAASGETLEGRTYGEILAAFPSACVAGISTPDGVRLNPPMDRVLGHGEGLMVLATDDSEIGRPTAPPRWRPLWQASTPADRTDAERTLVVGWSHYVPLIAVEIDRLVPAGSQLDVVLDPTLADPAGAEGLRLEHQKLSVRPLGSLQLTDLERLIGESRYDHILLVCYRDALCADDADARALLNLMAVQRGRNGQRCNVVTELLQVEDTDLADVARPDDFVVSDRLMSLAMAQISEHPALAQVFRDLLDSTDVAVQSRPWQDFATRPGASLDADHDVSFSAVVEAARAEGQSAIGWRCAALRDAPGDLGGGLQLNPRKHMTVRLQDGDHIITIGRPPEVHCGFRHDRAPRAGTTASVPSDAVTAGAA